jgi:hypothetical protein
MTDGGFDPQIVGEWLRNAKDAVGLFNTAKGLLPKGKERDDLEAKVHEAEAALARSNALLAKGFGYKLCQCKLPPTVMLWRERDKAFVCSNTECGRRIEDDHESVRFTPDYS